MITRTLLTQSQIQGSTDVDPLLNTVTDYLCFVTEFFDIICKSVPHIYHSALPLTPQSSIVWGLYNQLGCSPVERVVTGVPTLWDSCTASTGTTLREEVSCAIWSPCGQFIAATNGNTIQLQDSNTLGRVSVLQPPHSLLDAFPTSLTFSPDGNLLASFYHK